MGAILEKTRLCMTSAAKCHEHHEIFTNENNEHLRGSLMIIADTQWKCVMTCRTDVCGTEFNAILWVTSAVKCHCLTQQHSWLKWSSNQLKNTTEMIRGETQTVGRPITCLVTFCLAHPTLGHSLALTHSLTTFSVGDNYDILGIYLACGPKQQNGHYFSPCQLWLSVGSNRARKHAHFVAWNHSHAPHISHDYRDDHRLKMSWPSDWPRVGCTQCHQVCNGHISCLRLASDHHSRARETDMILFQSDFLMTLTVTFFSTVHVNLECSSSTITLQCITKGWCWI